MFHVFEKHDVALDQTAIRKATTLYDFDEHFTRVVSGYESVHAYYDDASCSHTLHQVSVPLLCLNALDDPLCPPSAFPIEAIESNPDVLLACSVHGGHVAWLEQSWRPFDLTWMDRVTGEFLRACWADRSLKPERLTRLTQSAPQLTGDDAHV